MAGICNLYVIVNVFPRIFTAKIFNQMKIRTYVFVFFTAFATTFFLASCLNEENKIPENCYDGILNNGEFLVDCGGPNCEECNHCINGSYDPLEGETWVDCGGECGACPTCANGQLDPGEVGIDCGPTCQPCANLCNDGLLNGTEELTDCGGAYCDACPTCDDGIINGDEFGIDCGGTNCDPCPTDGSCVNGIVDGDEYWTDCGGSTCYDCLQIFNWKAGTTEFVTPLGGITASEDGTTMTVSGTAGTGITMNINITNSIGNWVQGSTFAATPANFPNISAAYTTPVNIFSSENTGSNLSITMTRFVPAPNFVRLTFSGALKAADGTNISIQNGVFQFDFP